MSLRRPCRSWCTQHGGRPPAPTVVTALGDRAEVHLDGGHERRDRHQGGVRRAHLSGWPRLLYGLTAGGERGLQHAVDTSRQQVQRTLQRLGVTSLAELALNRVQLGWVRLWRQGKIAL